MYKMCTSRINRMFRLVSRSVMSNRASPTSRTSSINPISLISLIKSVHHGPR